MEAFLDLLSSGSLQIEPLLAHQFPVEEGGKAYAAVEAGNYTGIIGYHASGNVRLSAKLPSISELAAQPQPAGKLRVGCIGAGGFARGTIFPHLRSSAGLILESVATTTGAAAESARAGFGFSVAESPSELISNPSLDAVFVMTRHDSHAAYVKSALEQGKRVFVEKPLAINREQLEMVRTAYARCLATNGSAFLMVGFNRRFSPLTEKLKNFFARRTEPMMVHVRCNAGFIPRDSWLQSPENGGRIVGELCHFIDWARAVVGYPIQALTAMGLSDSGRYNRDNVTVTISFEDGSLANVLYLSNGDRAVAKEHFEVFCANGIARLDDFKALHLSRNGKNETSKGGRDKGHRQELDLTVKAMQHGLGAPIPFAELMEITEATFAVEEAIRTQKKVYLVESRTPA
jgi:predicted dehydrogenase